MTEEKELPVCTCSVIKQETVEDVKRKLPKEASLSTMAELFKCLSDPTRLAIIHALLIHELCVCEIGELLGMSTPAISHHLKILRFLRLVTYRRSGKVVYYAIADNHITQILVQALAHIEEE